MKILICGLPGSGKTWLAERLVKNLKDCAWYNADVVRRCANDWDFSEGARIRQANRMKTFADFERSNGRWVVCDFVAPTDKARQAFEADYIIWLDTIEAGRFEDTNQMFEKPANANIHIKNFMTDEQIKEIAMELTNV